MKEVAIIKRFDPKSDKEEVYLRQCESYSEVSKEFTDGQLGWGVAISLTEEQFNSLKEQIAMKSDELLSNKMKIESWCKECKIRKKVSELYIDERKIVVTLECGHEFYALEKAG